MPQQLAEGDYFNWPRTGKDRVIPYTRPTTFDTSALNNCPPCMTTVAQHQPSLDDFYDAVPVQSVAKSFAPAPNPSAEQADHDGAYITAPEKQPAPADNVVQDAINAISALITAQPRMPSTASSSTLQPSPPLSPATSSEPMTDSDDDEGNLLAAAPSTAHKHTVAAPRTLSAHPHLEVRSAFLFLLTLRDFSAALDARFSPLLRELARASTNRTAAVLARYPAGLPGLHELAVEMRAGKWEVWYESSRRMADAAAVPGPSVNVDLASPLCRSAAVAYEGMNAEEKMLFLRMILRS